MHEQSELVEVAKHSVWRFALWLSIIRRVSQETSYYRCWSLSHSSRIVRFLPCSTKSTRAYRPSVKSRRSRSSVRDRKLNCFQSWRSKTPFSNYEQFKEKPTTLHNRNQTWLEVTLLCIGSTTGMVSLSSTLSLLFVAHLRFGLGPKDSSRSCEHDKLQCSFYGYSIQTPYELFTNKLVVLTYNNNF